MPTQRIDCVLPIAAKLGESPVWDPSAQLLYWTDIYGRRLHRFDPASGADEVWELRDCLASFALCEDGRLIAAFHDGFAFVDLAAGTRSRIVNPVAGDARVYLNDGRCDRSGKFFWAGSVDRSRVEKNGALFRLDAAGTCTRMAEGVTSSNGIAFAPDNRVLYYADSRNAVIWRFDHEPATGALDNRAVFAALGADDGLADGAAVDAEGCYWSARVLVGRLVRHRPDGSVDRVIDMPVSAPTMMAFGGADLRTLYVTTARKPLDPAVLAQEPDAGSLYAIALDVPGLPEARFRPHAALRSLPPEPLS